jgi:hypothetical protein
MGIDDCALYPLFTEELLATMRPLIPPERLDRPAVSAVIRAACAEDPPTWQRLHDLGRQPGSSSSWQSAEVVA